MCKLLILLLILFNFCQDVALFRNLQGKNPAHPLHCKPGDLQWLELFMRGGSSSDITKYPNVVSLRDVGTYRHFCGGSIISDRHVVTAAQCFCRKNLKLPEKFVVVTGVTIIERPAPNAASTYKVERTICHPDYMEISTTHDIALLVIEDTFHYTHIVNQIEMVLGSYKDMLRVAGDLPVTLVGWNVDESKDDQSSNLQVLNSKTLEASDCKTHMQEGGINHDIGQPENEICTFNADKDSGMGNNRGTPVIHDGKLIGVTIWGKCKKNVPDVHSSIKHHYSWIYHEVLESR